VLCDVCRTDNPEKLLYCQECGNRLRSAARDAGPTVPAARRGRPAAPELGLADAAPTSPATLEPAPPALAPGECPSCHHGNPPAYRFCAVCGGPIERTPPPRASSTSPAAGSTQPPAHRPAPLVPVLTAAPSASAELATGRTEQNESVDPSVMRLVVAVGEPVVESAPAPVAPPRTPASPRADGVTCWNCHGAIESEARFCKHCGSNLAHPTAAPARDDVPDLVAPATANPSLPPLEVSAPPPAGPVLALEPSLNPPSDETVAPVDIPSLPAPTFDLHAHRDRGTAAASAAGQSPGEDAVVGAQNEAVEATIAAPVAQPLAPPVRVATTLAPARAERARLVVVTESGADGASFVLGSPMTTIGREEGDILLSEDPYVSPRHAVLSERDGGYWLRDLGSLNGVYRRLRAPHTLEDRDLLLLGSQVVQFRAVSPEERNAAVVVQHGTRLFGSEPIVPLGRLELRQRSGAVGDVHQLRLPVTVVGREQGDVLFGTDGFMSRRHASIATTIDQRLVLEDLGSSNGTFVALRGEVKLTSGDHVRIGQHLLRFEASATTP
jgi:pSer/pThr/pTyr-binding forkhead associated (FHA) protein